MVETLDQKSLFSKGTYLHERKPGTSSESPSNLPTYENWRESAGLTDETLSFRLSESKLTLDEFKHILQGKDKPVLKQEFSWMETLQTMITQPGHTLVTDEINELLGNTVFGYFYLPFLDYANDLIIQFIKQVEMKNDLLRIDDSSVRLSVLSSLGKKLNMLAVRSLIQELHIAKLTDQLEGDTSEARYRYFNEQKLTDSAFVMELISVYPVLARLLVEETERCIRSHTEALERFIKDRHIIERVFFPANKNPLTLKSLQAGAGDSHQEGRSVMIFSFENEQKLVYKPHSLHIDQHFNDLITWINEKDPDFSLKAPQTISRSLYGWQEFIPQTSCNSPGEIKRFYFRQGGYIALLYLLGSKDFHNENIIAAGSQPVFIDLETLFNNHDHLLSQDSGEVPYIVKEYSQSVLGSLMLPARVSVKGNIDFDLSALGGESGQESETITTWKLEHLRTDNMRLVKAPVFSTGSQNRPSIQGEPVNAADYTNEVEAGFRCMYALFIRYRKELMDPAGPIYRFSKDQVRHVLRATQVYGNFLETSTHPDYLQDGLKRERLFDFFWQITKSFSMYRPLVHSECQDLLKHDVPYFTFQFDSRDIVNSQGTIIRDFYERSSLELVLERCEKLNLEDCEKQQHYIRMSLSTLLKGPGDSKEKHLPVQTDAFIDQLTFLEEAKKIGDDLAKDVMGIHEDDDMNWLGLTLDGKDRLTFEPLKDDLYSGLSGITLFFAQLANETGDLKYKRLAQGALKSTLKMADQQKGLTGLSAFHGSGATAYAAAYLGKLWGQNDLIDIALDYVNDMEDMIGQGPHSDFLGGEAGAVIVCLRIHEIVPESNALDAAKKCGDYLENMLLPTHPPIDMWAGLSHGTSGYAWPMIALGIAAKEDRFIKRGFDLLDYERTLYIPKQKNWRDLRKEGKEPSPAYWCHGAPGIGLARLNILKMMENDHAEKELATAVETTFNHGFKTSHSLCHGDFGNLDILLMIARHQQDEQLTARIKELGASVLQQGRTMGWKHGHHPKADIHGLMLGAAGIGYGLLRLWNDNVPSVLNLELPRN